MKKELPIPIFRNDKIYEEIEFDRPKLGTIADVKKIADTGDTYAAICEFITRCTMAIHGVDGSDVTDKVAIKTLIRHLPYRSAEYISMEIMLLYDPNDGIEGVYKCPRCGNKIVSQLVEKDGEVEIDTRDFISNLKLSVMRDYVKTWKCEFAEVVSVKAVGSAMESADTATAPTAAARRTRRGAKITATASATMAPPATISQRAVE